MSRTGWSSGIVKFLKWRGNNTHAIREPVIMNYLKAVKEATTTKVGVAGFCWVLLPIRNALMARTETLLRAASTRFLQEPPNIVSRLASLWSMQSL